MGVQYLIARVPRDRLEIVGYASLTHATRALVIYRHDGITKAQMKEIEAARVRELREQGHKLPLNREKDKRYQPKGKGKLGGCR